MGIERDRKNTEGNWWYREGEGERWRGWGRVEVEGSGREW